MKDDLFGIGELRDNNLEGDMRGGAEGTVGLKYFSGRSALDIEERMRGLKHRGCRLPKM